MSIVICVLFWVSLDLFSRRHSHRRRRRHCRRRQTVYLHITVLFVFSFIFVLKGTFLGCYLKQKKCVRFLNLCFVLTVTIFGRTTTAITVPQMRSDA